MDKNDFDEHFLDSNILIGFVLRWDHLNNDCDCYFKENCSKNTSERVYNESRRRIENYRKMQINFLTEIYEESVNNTRWLFRFDDELRSFINRYTNSDKHQQFKLSRRRFGDSIRNFTQECYDEIRQSTLDYLMCENFLQKIIISFSDGIAELDNICYTYEDVKTHVEPFESYENEYPTYEDNLLQLGVHPPDHRILLDCYYFTLNKFDKKTAFITKDGGIIRNSADIEDLLNGVFVHTI